MKNLLSLLLISTLYINSSLRAQIIHVSEDFNAATLPTGWTTTAVSGSQTWSFGSIGTATNLNGTSMAYFDDDVLGGTSLNNTADLLTPTFDNSSFTKTFLEFDYNFYEFSQAADSFMVDVYDGSSWNRVFLRSTNDCGRWTLPICNNNFPRALIDISSFNNANCQVRFRYFDGNDWSYQVGVDNVSIYSLVDYDIDFKNLFVEDTTNQLSCELGSKIISFSIQNIGALPIDTFIYCMQINQGIITKDTIYSRILTGNIDTFNLNGFYRFSNRDTNAIKAWVTLASDTINSNDTLEIIHISQVSKNLPYYEDFDNMITNASLLSNDWLNYNNSTRIDSNGLFAWYLSNTSTPSSNTGPDKDHTGNNFIYTEASYPNTGDTASLISPCIYIDSSISNPDLSFYLHKYSSPSSSIGHLYVDVYDSNRWLTIDSVIGSIQDRDYKKFVRHDYSLSRFNNKNIRIRFRSIKGSFFSDIAIDAVSIVDSNIINLSNYLTTLRPDTFSVERRHKIRTVLHNSSESLFLPGQVSMAYDINGVQSMPEIINDTIAPKSFYTYDFNQVGDFSNGGRQNIKTYITSMNKNLLEDDTSKEFFYFLPENLPIHIDYENYSDKNPFSCYNSITTTDINRKPFYFNSNFGSVHYYLRDTNYCNPNIMPNSGSSFLSGYGANSYIVGAFSLNNYSRVTFEYSFHRTGFASSDRIYLQVIDSINIPNPVPNSNVYNLDTLTGNYQINANDSYITRQLDLSQFIGKNVLIRFYTQSYPQNFGTMAFDDLKLFEPTITNLEDNISEKEILLLYPNPNNGSFQIEIGEDLIGQEYQLFNISGQEIRSGKFVERNEALDISNEKAGIYFLQVPNKGINKKVVVY